MSIRVQMNDFGPIALLPDGRVEVLKHEALDLIQEINQGQKIYSADEFEHLILYDFEIDLDNFHLSAPLIAFLEITNVCNLSCTHCYANSSPTAKRQNELTLDQIYGLLDQWDNAGVMQVFLSGGEIFAHPNAVEIINYAMSKKFVTQIFSNGLLIKEEHLSAIHEGTSFFISFDSASPETTIRGKMTYEKLGWLFKTMEKYGHVFRPAINVHGSNLNEVTELFRWCRENKFPRPQWLETLPVGRAFKNQKLFITTDQTKQTLEVYKASMEIFASYNKTNAVRAKSLDTIKFCQRLEVAIGGDKAGRMIAYVNSVGDVYPSSNFASHNRDCAGNIHEADFHTLWKTGFVNVRSTWFVDFKDCANCPLEKAGVWCQFRCRSLSENIHGDPLVCGATPHLKNFILMSHQINLEMKNRGLQLELMG